MKNIQMRVTVSQLLQLLHELYFNSFSLSPVSCSPPPDSTMKIRTSESVFSPAARTQLLVQDIKRAIWYLTHGRTEYMIKDNIHVTLCGRQFLQKVNIYASLWELTHVSTYISHMLTTANISTHTQKLIPSFYL